MLQFSPVLWICELSFFKVTDKVVTNEYPAEPWEEEKYVF